MRLRVVWLGRPGGSPFEGEIERYRRRVSHRWTAEDLAVRPVSGGREDDPARVRASEAEKLRRQVPRGWSLVVLDETGRAMGSEDLARWLGGAEERSDEGVVFAIGSDLGLAGELDGEARLKLSLGPLTLPHRIARLVLWEQLYRATQILSGGAYHRVG